MIIEPAAASVKWIHYGLLGPAMSRTEGPRPRMTFSRGNPAFPDRRSLRAEYSRLRSASRVKALKKGCVVTAGFFLVPPARIELATCGLGIPVPGASLYHLNKLRLTTVASMHHESQLSTTVSRKSPARFVALSPSCASRARRENIPRPASHQWPNCLRPCARTLPSSAI